MRDFETAFRGDFGREFSPYTSTATSSCSAPFAHPCTLVSQSSGSSAKLLRYTPVVSFSACHVRSMLSFNLNLSRLSPSTYPIWKSLFINFIHNYNCGKKFVNHFQKLYSCNIKSRADALHNHFTYLRSSYVGDCLSASHAFDTELVSKVVSELHQGKAPHIVGLTGEHLQLCHPLVLVLLNKLFQLIMLSGCVFSGFKHIAT